MHLFVFFSETIISTRSSFITTINLDDGNNTQLLRRRNFVCIDKIEPFSCAYCNRMLYCYVMVNAFPG